MRTVKMIREGINSNEFNSVLAESYNNSDAKLKGITL